MDERMLTAWPSPGGCSAWKVLWMLYIGVERATKPHHRVPAAWVCVGDIESRMCTSPTYPPAPRKPGPGGRGLSRSCRAARAVGTAAEAVGLSSGLRESLWRASVGRKAGKASGASPRSRG